MCGIILIMLTSALPLRAAEWLSGKSGRIASGPQVSAPRMQQSMPSSVTDYKQSVNLLPQFPAGENLQGSISDCHDFAELGLVEAAYYRKYGKPLDLAEQDLFATVKIHL